MVILDFMAAQQGELYDFFIFKVTSSFSLEIFTSQSPVVSWNTQVSVDTL